MEAIEKTLTPQSTVCRPGTQLSPLGSLSLSEPGARGAGGRAVLSEGSLSPWHGGPGLGALDGS